MLGDKIYTCLLMFTGTKRILLNNIFEAKVLKNEIIFYKSSLSMLENLSLSLKILHRND